MRKALSSVKPAWKELAYTRAARVPRARRARRWVRPPSGGQSPVAAAPDACAAAGTARRALRRPCLLIANASPDTITELFDEMTRVTRRLRRPPALLRAF